MAEKKQDFNFEQTLGNLEALVQKMESGALSLEESLQAFETGVRLTRECQQALSRAEQKIQQLLEQNGELKTRPFDPLSEDE